MKFEGTIKYVFNDEAGALEFLQAVRPGMEGQIADWPQNYDFGDDNVFDKFKINSVVKSVESDVVVKLSFEVENTGDMSTPEFVDAVKEDFSALEGVDTDDWYIERARARVAPAQAGRRRKTYKKKRASKKTRKH